MADHGDGRHALLAKGTPNRGENRVRRPVFVHRTFISNRIVFEGCLLNSILGMFVREPVMNFDARWQSREEGGIKWLEEEIKIGEVSVARGIYCHKCHGSRWSGKGVHTFWRDLFLDARR